MNSVKYFLEGIYDKYISSFTIPNITFVDVVEIIIISVLIYNVLAWGKTTKAFSLLRGIGILLIFVAIAAIFRMNTILWIAEKAINVGIIALVVIFQPELRRALDRLGKQSFFMKWFSFGNAEQEKVELFNDRVINEIVKATFEMAKVKTGALIVIAKDDILTEWIRTGIDVDAKVTSQLLINIFEKNTPLHDGAVIINGDRVVSATCYLPMSDNMDLDKELGTRHRAAVGMTEVTDTTVIVVSEETGKVSVSADGKLIRDVGEDALRAGLRAIHPQGDDLTAWGRLKRRMTRAKGSS